MKYELKCQFSKRIEQLQSEALFLIERRADVLFHHRETRSSQGLVVAGFFRPKRLTSRHQENLRLLAEERIGDLDLQSKCALIKSLQISKIRGGFGYDNTLTAFE